MKRTLFALLFALLAAMGAQAQTTVKYGTLSYDLLLKLMPEYATAQRDLQDLRKKYEAEASYNEHSFKRQFSEFLQGQKEFPQNILLKRQRDLQDAMEKGIAFRHAADSLLRHAEADLLKPVRAALNAAIRAVGQERGYEYILNTDRNAYPYIHESLVEDAMPYVLDKLGLGKKVVAPEE